jgi:polygalacturonase
LLKDFSIYDAPNWCLHLGGCRYTNIQSLTILNSLFIPNADGIDASNCQYLNINNCNIIAGDDGIAISPCADGYCSQPSENYTVSNCNIVSRSAGIRVGYGVNDIRNFVFKNINIQSNRGIGLFVRQNQHIENVLFSNIVIQTAFMNGVWWGNGDPIHISAVPQTTDTTIGQIRNIRFSNLRIESENGIDIYSISKGHIRDIVFDGISMLLKKGANTDAFGGNFDLRPVHDKSLKIFKHDIAALYAYQADGITVSNMHLEWDSTLPDYFNHGLWFQKSSGIDINKITLAHPPASLKGKATVIE